MIDMRGPLLLALMTGAMAEAQPLVELPAEAPAGECYVEIATPERIETVTELVLIRDESYEIRTIPAVYETEIQRHLVKEAATDYKAIPASYKTVMETIEIAPGQEATYAKQVLVAPGELIEVPIPAEYEDIEVEILVMPERQERVLIPAEYKFNEKQVAIGGTREWHRVLCNTNSTHDHMAQIQTALTQAGYPATADGLFGPQTLAAMEAYQQAHGLPVGYLTESTVAHLGVAFD